METQTRPMHTHPVTRRSPLARRAPFFRSRGGFAAAEAVLLAMVFLGLSLMVGRILKPAIQTVARNLNRELAGGQ